MAHPDMGAGLVDGQIQEARVLQVLGALTARLRDTRLAYPAARADAAARLWWAARVAPATLDRPNACHSTSAQRQETFKTAVKGRQNDTLSTPCHLELSAGLHGRPFARPASAACAACKDKRQTTAGTSGHAPALAAEALDGAQDGSRAALPALRTRDTVPLVPLFNGRARHHDRLWVVADHVHHHSHALAVGEAHRVRDAALLGAGRGRWRHLEPNEITAWCPA